MVSLTNNYHAMLLSIVEQSQKYDAGVIMYVSPYAVYRS